MRILLLEDEIEDVLLFQENLNLCKSILGKELSLVTCATLADAIKETISSNFEIIFCDLNVPDSTGISTIQSIYKACSRIPIIAFTTNDDLKLISEVVRAGAQDFLAKNNLDFGTLGRSMVASIARKKIENDLVEATENKTSFISYLSHELRTPLNVIIGMTDGLAGEDVPARDVKKYLEIVSRSGHNLLGLVNDILDISKIEAGKLELNESTINIFQICRFLEDSLKILAQQKDLKLIFEIDKNLPLIRLGDRLKILQVLNNLISNAINYTDSGSVVVRVTPQNNIHVNFSVSDTGLGISEKDREKIFKPFEQVNIGDRKHLGTGLGLTISKLLVEKMGGELKVEVNGEVGSTFHFSLPLPKVQEDVNDTKELNSPEKTDAIRCLIVDDNENNILVISKFLQKINTDSRVAYNGQEAVDFYDNQAFDIIFMDIQMPVMNGIEAIIKIREIEEKKKLIPCKILVVSASDHDSIIEDVLKAGADDFLPKPILKKALFECISKLLNIDLGENI